MLVPYSKLESCTLFFPSLNLHYLKDCLLFLLAPIKGHSQTLAFFKSTVCVVPMSVVFLLLLFPISLVCYYLH